MSVVETSGTKKRRITGRTDYTVGFGKGIDVFDITIPREVHMVAVQEKASISGQDIWQCVTQAASLYKTRLDAGKDKKSVSGILSNAETWKFIFIDERGLLHRSPLFIMELNSYNEDQVLLVYRMVHYIVKCCYGASTPPPSMAPTAVSLNE